MEQKNKALGRGLEQLFNSELLDFDSFESNILESASSNDIKEIKELMDKLWHTHESTLSKAPLQKL